MPNQPLRTHDMLRQPCPGRDSHGAAQKSFAAHGGRTIVSNPATVATPYGTALPLGGGTALKLGGRTLPPTPGGEPALNELAARCGIEVAPGILAIPGPAPAPAIFERINLILPMRMADGLVPRTGPMSITFRCISTDKARRALSALLSKLFWRDHRETSSPPPPPEPACSVLMARRMFVMRTADG